MSENKIEHNIKLGLERLKENSRFLPKSIINDDKFLSAYAFTNNDYRIFHNWITVIMEVKAIDTSRSFFIPCILRKVPERIFDRRINYICYERCNQFSLNDSYIEDLEIVLNEKYYKILAENNFMKAVYCENEELKIRQSYSFDNNMSAASAKWIRPRKCNLAFYPYSFDILAYTSSRSAWNNELINIGIIDDESFHNIKRLSKQHFTIKDVILGDFISSLTLNEGYNDDRNIQNGYQNVIMRCVCNSDSLVFYDNSTFHNTDSFYSNRIENHDITINDSADLFCSSKIENHNITINENDSKFNIEYVTDKQIKKLDDSFYDGEYHKPEIKKEENKLNIIITNDEFLI